MSLPLLSSVSLPLLLLLLCVRLLFFFSCLVFLCLCCLNLCMCLAGCLSPSLPLVCVSLCLSRPFSALLCLSLSALSPSPYLSLYLCAPSCLLFLLLSPCFSGPPPESPPPPPSAVRTVLAKKRKLCSLIVSCVILKPHAANLHTSTYQENRPAPKYRRWKEMGIGDLSTVYKSQDHIHPEISRY